MLYGLRITNVSADSLSFNYSRTAVGPAAIVPDSASFAGTTGMLGPGVSYSPDPDTLLIPAIRNNTQELVTYHVSAVGYPNVVDSCTTTITFDPPVPIQISNFQGKAINSGVELMWDIETDENIERFQIHRKAGEKGAIELINSDELISPETRKYIDSDVRGGRTYQYTLGIVRGDGSEVQSQTISVKTKAFTLGLNQNYPNPFNPTTTISYTLPRKMHVNLSIFNVEGKLVKTLLDVAQEEGFRKISWDGKATNGSPVSSGVYFYRLKAGKKVLTKKMVMLK